MSNAQDIFDSMMADKKQQREKVTLHDLVKASDLKEWEVMEKYLNGWSMEKILQQNKGVNVYS